MPESCQFRKGGAPAEGWLGGIVIRVGAGGKRELLNLEIVLDEMRFAVHHGNHYFRQKAGNVRAELIPDRQGKELI
jgi:hypothetical protein